MADTQHYTLAGALVIERDVETEHYTLRQGLMLEQAAAAVAGGGITNTNLVGSPGRLAGIGGGLAG